MLQNYYIKLLKVVSMSKKMQKNAVFFIKIGLLLLASYIQNIKKSSTGEGAAGGERRIGERMEKNGRIEKSVNTQFELVTNCHRLTCFYPLRSTPLFPSGAWRLRQDYYFADYSASPRVTLDENLLFELSGNSGWLLNIIYYIYIFCEVCT